MGENGLIYTFYGNQYHQIFIPGQNPKKIDIPSDGKVYELMYFGQQGYILTFMVSYDKIRWKITRPLPSSTNEEKLEVKVVDSNTGLGSLDWYDSSLIYTKYSQSGKLYLFDINSERETCIFSNPMNDNLQIIGIDKNFVYFHISSHGDKIYRTELSGKNLTQQYKLPTECSYMDFYQPFLLGLFKLTTNGKSRLSPGVFNIDTGELKEFEMDIPSDYFFSSSGGEYVTADYRKAVLLEKLMVPARVKNVPYTIKGDAEYGYLIILFENKIYMLNEIKTITKKRSSWEPIENNPQ